MIKPKKIKNFINIDKKKVSLISEKRHYRVLEFSYSGKIKIIPLLDKNFMIKNNNNKILIINLNDYLFPENLFNYFGNIIIYSCNAYDNNSRVDSLYINQTELQQWNTFIKVDGEDGDGPIYDSMTRNWEDMDFDGNNNKSNRIYRKTIYNKETRTYTTTKEIRKR